MINQDIIKSKIMSLGKMQFDILVSFVMKKLFNYYAIDVDGNNDGGCDLRVMGFNGSPILFHNSSKNPVLAIQKTIQDTNWENKAFQDAKHALEKIPNLSGYVFLTSIPHGQVALRRIEQKISNELGIPASCYGARELSGMIFESHLFGEFAAILGLPIDDKILNRPDANMVMLHSFFALNEGREKIREEVYDIALSIKLFSYGDLGCDQTSLITDTIRFLNIGDNKSHEFIARINSLLSRGKINKVEKKLYLSEESRKDIEIANSIYLSEMDLLKKDLLEIISSNGGMFSDDQCAEIALLIAQVYVEKQSTTLNRLALSTIIPINRGTGVSPLSRLTTLLFSAGITRDGIDNTVSQIITLASSNPLIKKLVNVIIYLTIENSRNSCAVLMLGRYDWRDVKVLIDASVAIPYLVTSIFGAAQGRFSSPSIDIIKTLQGYNAQLALTQNYLNECASHLVAAYDYILAMDDFSEELCESTNGYVAYYCQMKKRGADVPDTLHDFICNISDNAVRPIPDKNYKIRLVMGDLQPLFAEHNILFEPIPTYDSEKYRKPFEIDYAYYLDETRTKKAPILLEHDLNTLAHIQRNYTEKNEVTLLLTWDKIFIKMSLNISRDRKSVV